MAQDPARPTSPHPVSEKLQAWLQYYDDLGIRLFYRDRPASAATIARLEIPATGEIITAKPTSTAAPAKLPATPAKRPTPALTVLPVEAAVRGPSLFESAERIAGDTLERISADLGDCTRCKLHRHRNKIVFGAGNPHAELVFVGEGPGHDEDMQGVPFVGRAGKLLTQMIEAMGLTRDQVYIANVVKCRPPENRTPEKDEVTTCMPFLLRQLAAINPKVIVCLGSCATQALLGSNKSISTFRGQWLEFRGARLMATYHPAYLLRNPPAKTDVWADLKKVMAVLGLKPPRRNA
jgi:uracil-DNA glycosylase family 4